MDYSLAALKLLCVQLKSAGHQSPPPESKLSIYGVLFQRVWLQGVLIPSDEENGCFLLDDGTGIVALHLSGDFRNQGWKTGMYVMVVGGYFIRTGQTPMIKVHKIVDLSRFPDREAMWFLEVMEAYKLFYQPSPVE